MSSNLYQIVDREKRILYEERVAGPSVSIARAEGQSANLREDNDNPASVQIRLSEALEEDVVLNLVGSGTATYGASADYQVSVGNEACDAITMGNCQVTIPMGSASADVMVTAREDGGGEPAEEITLSIAIALAGNTGLMLGSPSSLTLIIDADPTAGFVLSSSTVEEPATGTIEHRIAVSLSASPAADIIIEAGFHSDGTTEIVDDYNSSDEQKRVTFVAGATGDDLVQEVVLIINADEEVEGDETIVLTLVGRRDSLTSNGNNFTIENARHTVTIPANDQPEEPAALPTISFDAATKTAIEGDDATNAQTTATLSIAPPPTSDVVIPYTVGGDGVENTDYLFSFRATSGSASVSADGLNYPANATGVVFTITARDDTDRMSETVAITINDAAANFPAGYEIGSHRTVTITLEDTTLPTVSLNYSGAATIEESTAITEARMTIDLSEALSEDVTLNLVGSGMATYGTAAFTSDWQLLYKIISAGQTPETTFTVPGASTCTAVTGSSCQVTITAGAILVDVAIAIHSDGISESPEEFTISLVVPSTSSSLVELGSSSSHMITITDPAEDPA